MKTKKVPNIKFFGVLFFLMFFGGFVPFLNVKYEGMIEPFKSGDSCECIVFSKMEDFLLLTG